MSEAADPIPERKVQHPATWSRNDLTVLDKLVPPGVYLDCCAGIGKIYRIERPDRCFVTVEIEKPWADVEPRTIHGDMFKVVQEWVDFGTRFDGIVVSWVFGNRMSDHHKASDSSRRRSYTHDIRTMTGDEGYELADNNAGTMYFWQPAYKEWHERAYALLSQVVNESGHSFFNVKNFYRTTGAGENRKQQLHPVVGWHVKAMKQNGWDVIEIHNVKAESLRDGENYEARADYEAIIEARRAT